MLDYNLTPDLKAQLREEGLKTEEFHRERRKEIEEILFCMLMSKNKDKWSEHIDKYKLLYAFY